MPELTIYKGETGELEGFGEKGRRAWLKFRKLVAELQPGEMIQFGYRIPRSPVHHRFFFWRMQALLDRQESFADLDRLLTFLKVGAGWVDFMPGPDGQLVAVPKSIDWTSLDEQGFIEVKRAVWDFLWTPQAQAALWPQMTPNARYIMIDQWVREAEL